MPSAEWRVGVESVIAYYSLRLVPRTGTTDTDTVCRLYPCQTCVCVPVPVPVRRQTETETTAGPHMGAR